MFENQSCLFYTVEDHCVVLRDFALNILIFLIGAAIIALNAFVFVVLTREADMDDPKNVFLANLSVADFLVGFFVIYDVLYNIFQFKVYIECVLRLGLFHAVNILSVLSLMALTLDRYYKVKEPLFYRSRVTARKIHFVEGSLWVFSIIIGLLPFFGWSSMNLFGICTYFGIVQHSYTLLVVALFATPFFVMSVVYVQINRLARRSQLDSNDGTLTLDRRHKLTSTWKFIRTSAIIVGAYLLCWAPIGVFLMLEIFTDVKQYIDVSKNVLFTYLLALGVFNSLLNPLIYAWRIPEIRRCLKKAQVFKLLARRNGHLYSDLPPRREKSSKHRNEWVIRNSQLVTKTAVGSSTTSSSTNVIKD